MGGSSSTSGKNSHLVVFDKKVSEADKYLQLMIDQTTKIEQRIEIIEDVEEREKYDLLKEQANVSWEFNDVCFVHITIVTICSSTGNVGSHQAFYRLTTNSKGKSSMILMPRHSFIIFFLFLSLLFRYDCRTQLIQLMAFTMVR